MFNVTWSIYWPIFHRRKLWRHIGPVNAEFTGQSARLLANDSVADFARRAEGWHADHLVVGHLPFMDRAVAYLVTGSETPGVVAFRPGSIVCLERDDDSWRLTWMIRPELLGHGG